MEKSIKISLPADFSKPGAPFQPGFPTTTKSTKLCHPDNSVSLASVPSVEPKHPLKILADEEKRLGLE